MKRTRRPRHSLPLAIAVAVLASAPAPAALDASAWKHQQSLVVERAGLLKIALPPGTLGLAQPALEDLRLLDPAGREVPYALTTPAPAVPPVTRAPAAFRADLLPAATQLVIDTGTSAPLDALTLATPAPYFLKAARLECSNADGRWETLGAATAIFRQFGAAQLRLDLRQRSAARLRITIDDTRSRPIAFTGATLQLAGSTPAAVTTPIAVRLARREEFAGETVLTLDLGGANVPLAAVEFFAAEPLFARSVTFAVRELQDDAAVERTLGTGTIWRVAAEGLAPTAQLEVPVDFIAPSRELIVHLANGDSPPLPLDRLAARQRPRWLVFHAANPGTYALLTGHPQAPAPRYDLATLAGALRDAPPSNLAPGPATPNPGYRATPTLADTPLLGASLDPSPWSFRKPVRIAAAGVQQLELDLDVLARAQPTLGDLRLVRDGAQLPYLLERPALFRATPLAVTPVPSTQRPQVSRWQIRLSHAGAPVRRITLTSDTALFQRRLRLLEPTSDRHRGAPAERVLASADWSHTPGDTSPLTLHLTATPVADVIFLEADDGDNPPITLKSVLGAYPVARLLFKTDPAPVALYYGNRAASTPRYDLALVARQILAAEKTIASLGTEEPLRGGNWIARAVAATPVNIVFWGVLTLVVLGLLAVVAKLLPKPPAPPA